MPLPSRAARTYLDILFFHPFEDGNARAAMSALAFVLAREGVLLDQVHPLQTTAGPTTPKARPIWRCCSES
ncbi:Fic family protein [Streptomyces hirsutus]|uniref:Fic family protein n=1 Tax=Streptomyces hirsutus TaxID=35620 RepID=A0ABZ1H139_9ACTN|nr:Fic family protein [Streptomyces hirsutus]WTD22782.1 Fic family protein [Streptomyces hirsutus]WTD79679.1 Fic family protein [Streptomyces sp. NBC_01635]